MSPTNEVPKDDPEPFPESDAQTIRDQAGYIDTLGDVAAVAAALQTLPLLGVGGAATVAGSGDSFAAAMESLFEGIKDVLGDYTKARDIALDWAEQSNIPGDIREDLRDMMGAVDDYWEGVAFESFDDHINAVNEALRDTQSKMVEVAKTIANAITLVYDTWGSAISFVSKCAIDIVGSWDPNKIVDCLKNMAKDVVDLIEKAIKTMGGYKKDLAQLDITATTFPALPDNDDMLESAGNTDGWGVRPAPGT